MLDLLSYKHPSSTCIIFLKIYETVCEKLYFSGCFLKQTAHCCGRLFGVRAEPNAVRKNINNEVLQEFIFYSQDKGDVINITVDKLSK